MIHLSRREAPEPPSGEAAGCEAGGHERACTRSRAVRAHVSTWKEADLGGRAHGGGGSCLVLTVVFQGVRPADRSRHRLRRRRAERLPPGGERDEEVVGVDAVGDMNQRRNPPFFLLLLRVKKGSPAHTGKIELWIE